MYSKVAMRVAKKKEKKLEFGAQEIKVKVKYDTRIDYKEASTADGIARRRAVQNRQKPVL